MNIMIISPVRAQYKMPDMKYLFKFPDSYTKDDREIFFGRDREIEIYFFNSIIIDYF